MCNMEKRLYIIRHGQSESNVQHIVSCDIAQGKITSPLTDIGRTQIMTTMNMVIGDGRLRRDILTRIVYSPFLRTKQTAEIIKDFFQQTELVEDSDLRERDYGTYDGTSADIFKVIRAKDAMGESVSDYGVESWQTMRERMTRSILRHSQDPVTQVIFVSHGDLIELCLSHSLQEYGEMLVQTGELEAIHLDLLLSELT